MRQPSAISAASLLAFRFLAHFPALARSSGGIVVTGYAPPKSYFYLLPRPNRDTACHQSLYVEIFRPEKVPGLFIRRIG